MGFGAETTLCASASVGTNTGYCDATEACGAAVPGVCAFGCTGAQRGLGSEAHLSADGAIPKGGGQRDSAGVDLRGGDGRECWCCERTGGFAEGRNRCAAGLEIQALSGRWKAGEGSDVCELSL